MQTRPGGQGQVRQWQCWESDINEEVCSPYNMYALGKSNVCWGWGKERLFALAACSLSCAVRVRSVKMSVQAVQRLNFLKDTSSAAAEAARYLWSPCLVVLMFSFIWSPSQDLDVFLKGLLHFEQNLWASYKNTEWWILQYEMQMISKNIGLHSIHG